MHQTAAEEFATSADRGSDSWKSWRESDYWRQWNEKIAPAVAARRRALKLLGDKQAVQILFEEVAPRFAERPGGYTRILRLAKPRLGDAGTRAILEFVGVHDRVATKSAKPAFEADSPSDTGAETKDAVEATEQEVASTDETGSSETDASNENENAETESKEV